MQLISPPPEEMLRKNQRLPAQFTPSLLANTGASPVNPSTQLTNTVAKRKRIRPLPTPSSSRNMYQENHPPQLMEATPNPKPRKQRWLHSRQSSFGHLGSSNDDFFDQYTPSGSKTKRALVKYQHTGNPDFIDDLPLPALVLPVAKASGSALRRTLLSARSSRRSANPIPPYEPPMGVFTPPREVFLSPAVPKSMSKSSKRRTIALASASSNSAKGKKKGSTLTIVTTVKQELPDIDLSLPMPPPSPTDDPLLLSGPPERGSGPEPMPPRGWDMSVQTQEEQKGGVWNCDLPPSSLEPSLTTDEVEAVRVFDRNRNENAAPETSTDDSMMQLDPDDIGISPVRLFDIPLSSNGGWSDSDVEDRQGQTIAPGVLEGKEEGEGEYTGRWKMILVRTKQDPPSSATRERIEEWGRPISPFPKKLAKEESEEGHEEEEYQQVGNQPEEEYRRREELEDRKEARQMSIEPLGNTADSADMPLVAERQRDRRGLNSSREDNLMTSAELITSHDPQQPLHDLLLDIQQQQQENEEKEEQEVCQISVEFDDDEEPARPFNNLDLAPVQFSENSTCGNQAVSIPVLQPHPQPSPASAIELVVFPSIGWSPETGPSSYSAGLEYEITPATIFNENHPTQAIVSEQGGDDDCYTNIKVKQCHLEAKQRRSSQDFAKESRRRNVSGSGVAKVSNSRRRRSTLGMGAIGDEVFIPGSPALALPELLQDLEAELEVRNNRRSVSQRSSVLEGGDLVKTPIAAKYRAQTANRWMTNQKAEGYVGEREWTKEDWKHLDACFTDQMLEVGSRLAGTEQNPLAPVDIVSINDVIDKFAASKGESETVTKFGELWSRGNLSASALQKKQELGHVVPPTTPYTPLSVGSNRDVLRVKEREPCTQVPDFTPLGRRAAPPRKSGSTLQQPVTYDLASKYLRSEQEGPIIPGPLLAPIYSHLLEEAIATSQQGSTLLPGQEAQNNFPQWEIEEDTLNSYDVPSTTIGGCAQGLLFSYLSTLPKSSSTARKALIPLQPSLPLPPNDILAKLRGPVITPVHAPLSKPKHPKELVALHPAPQRSTISHIPRMRTPRRLVELHPPAPPPPIIDPTSIPRPRRSSGNSVKDLVRGFEELQELSQDKREQRGKNEGWKRYRPRC